MLSKHRQKLSPLLAQWQHACRQAQKEREELDKAKAYVADVEQAQALVQQVAEAVQNQAHGRLASIVSRCLETVFGDRAYEFKIEFNRARGKTEANLIFERDGERLDNPMEESGGGVLDLASFALRLSCLVLMRPKRRRLLVMDEPFKYLSRNHVPAVRQLLEKLCEEMDLQIIMVTHNPRLQIGKVVEL